MSEDLKAAVLRIARRPVEQTPLAEPPSLGSDLGVALICPNCFSVDGQRRQFEDVSMVECPECGAHFSGPRESVSKHLIGRLMEEERRRHRFLGLGRRRRHTHADYDHKPHEHQKHAFEQ